MIPLSSSSVWRVSGYLVATLTRLCILVSVGGHQHLEHKIDMFSLCTRSCQCWVFWIVLILLPKQFFGPFDNFAEDLEEFLKIMEDNDLDEEEFEHEDEDCAISPPARNYSTHVSFHTDDDIIEPANCLTEVDFADSDQEPTLQWQPEYWFTLRSSATYHLKRS